MLSSGHVTAWQAGSHSSHDYLHWTCTILGLSTASHGLGRDSKTLLLLVTLLDSSEFWKRDSWLCHKRGAYQIPVDS